MRRPRTAPASISSGSASSSDSAVIRVGCSGRAFIGDLGQQAVSTRSVPRAGRPSCTTSRAGRPAAAARARDGISCTCGRTRTSTAHCGRCRVRGSLRYGSSSSASGWSDPAPARRSNANPRSTSPRSEAMRARSNNGSGQSTSIDSAASSSRSAASMSPMRSSATARSQRNATRAVRGTIGSIVSANKPSAAAPARAGANRLGQQQLRQQRIGELGPELRSQIDELVDLGPRRAFTGCVERIGRRLVRADGVGQQQRHLVVHSDQRVQHERVIGIDVISSDQRFALTLETPTRKIESVGCQPFTVVCQTVVVDNLAQGRERFGEHCRVLDARSPCRGAEECTGSSASSSAASDSPTVSHALSEGWVATRSTTRPDVVSRTPTRSPSATPNALSVPRGSTSAPSGSTTSGGMPRCSSSSSSNPASDDSHRRTVGEPLILLVLAELGDRVQVRSHGE